MSLKRAYRLRCDGCGALHMGIIAMLEDTPRKARAKAKRDGWARRQIIVREYQMPSWIETPSGLWIQAGEGTQTVYDTAGRDFCPKCVEAMDGGGA